MQKIQEVVINARLSIQRALLGEISTQLRAVVFSVVDRDLDVRFYFDGVISEIDKESASCVETEILADYEPDDSVVVRCLRLDAPKSIVDDGIFVYQRRESLSNP